MWEIEKLKLEPCEKCGEKMKYCGTSSTMVGIHDFVDEQGRKHIHDDNCKSLWMVCDCGHSAYRGFKSKCNVNDCDW